MHIHICIRSIACHAGVTPEQLQEAALTIPIDLSHDKELQLAKCIIRFPEIIEKVSGNLLPHILCRYVYELCMMFTKFYHVCYCVETDRQTGKINKINMSRLLLCEATRKVLDQSFYILGLEPVSKM